jgi:pimeloyl-ACP methyl ester carboxylesterase
MSLLRPVEPDRRSLLLVSVLTSIALSTSAIAAQQMISFRTADGWTIHGALYGTGTRGVVLVHGGRFTKESWRPQAERLVRAGFRVLAIDMRGYGASTQGPKALDTGAGSPQDVLAAVRWLHTAGAKTVSVIGGSMGADAAAGASIDAAAGEIDALILLAGSADEPPGKLNGRKLFVVTREDANAAGPRLPRIRQQYDAATDPKELLILDGSAHAQFIFLTDGGERLMREILRFLQQ